MALIGLLGDAHGKFDVIFDIIERNPNVKRWFQVGDLGEELDNYPSFPSNFQFIQGNHENWDYISQIKETQNPLFLPNGSLNWYQSADLTYFVGVLGGNYSPKHYLSATESLSGRKRRFFTEEEYDSLIIQFFTLDSSSCVDILLTHEAPSPFKKSFADIGIPLITKLIQKIKPGIHFFGHHHSFKISDIDGVVSVGLDRVTRSYVLYDLVDKKMKKIDL